MTIVLLLVLIVLLGSLQAVFVACETAMFMLAPGRLDRMIESRVDGYEKLEILVEVRHRLRAMIIFFHAFVAMVCALVAIYIATAGQIVVLNIGWLSENALALANAGLLMLAGLLLSFILFQAIPRAFAVTNPEFILLKATPLSLAFTRLFGGFLSALSAPAKGIITAAGGDRKVTIWAVSPNWREEDEVEGEVAIEQEAIREAVSGLSNLIAREVMTPRTDMFALEDTASIRDAIELIGETGVSRIPIYHDNIDDIRGILYAKDLLRHIAAVPDWERYTKDNALLSIAHPAVFVPETKPVLDLMVEMRMQTHMVIVTDEYGGTSGLATLEDLLEEIVGDISDEFDPQEIMIKPLGPDRYILDARTSVSDLNDLYNTEFDLDADSVGGLFIELIGHIPEVGESIEADGIELVVTRVDGNRIVELRSYPKHYEEDE